MYIIVTPGDKKRFYLSRCIYFFNSIVLEISNKMTLNDSNIVGIFTIKTRSFAGLDDHKSWNLLPHENCGQGGPRPKVDIKVIGGNNAYLGQFPWMANLFVTCKNKIYVFVIII